MSIISTLLIKEKNRNESMIIEYTRELDALPKGTIKEKKVKDRVCKVRLKKLGCFPLFSAL